jgi:hypothetical protein
VAHRADGVPDLVRDAGRQPAERGQLGLLHALGEPAGVLEEHDQRRGPAAAERREVGLDFPAAVGRDDRRILDRRAVRPPAPPLDVVEQARRDLAEQRPRAGLGAEDLQRGLVDQPHAVLRIDDDDALAQVLHDVLGQLGQVREVEVALADLRLGRAQPLREERAAAGDQEQHDAVVAGLREAERSSEAGGPDDELLAEQRERRGRRDDRARCGVPSSDTAPTGTSSSSRRPLDAPPLA